MAELLTLDTQKQQNGVSEVFNIQEIFNARVGDEQVPFSVKFLERGKAQQFEDGLVPFMSGFVGNLDDDGKVTAETGEPVSYTGSRDDIVGLGMVKMNLPGTMFPQEGYFYGFLGLETPDHSKRVSTFSVWFHVYNGNPDMFVNKEPFRSELQKELDRVEVLIEQTEGTIKAKLIEWEKLITDLINNKNIDLEQLESRMATVEGNLTILEDKIKADGLLTQADFDAQMKTLMDTIESELAILKQPICVEQTIYGDPVEEQAPEIKQKLDSLTVGINPDKFNFVFITDPHYASSEETANLSVSYGVNHVNRALYLDQYVDMMVLGGDNIDGNQASIEGILTDQAQIATEFLFGSDNNSDKFPLKGNHDDGTERQVYFEAGRRPDRIPSLPAVITDAQFKRDYHTGDLLFGETRKGNSNYFYKDYPDKKIRIIGLDSNDRPEIKNDDGTEKYLGIWHLGYRQEQINWLANVALKNVPEDYTTLIVAHMQSWVKNGTNIHNADLVNKIIGDFITGGSTTLTSDDKDWEVNVKTDFTQQGARVLAGWIHGHEHSENIRTDGGYNNIGILASVGLGEAQNWLGDTDGWNLIELDTEKRTLTLKGFGIATDRKFDY